MTESELIEAVAKLLADEAYAWGDRRHDWEHSLDDGVRESWRETAAKVIELIRPTPEGSI